MIRKLNRWGIVKCDYLFCLLINQQLFLSYFQEDLFGGKGSQINRYTFRNLQFFNYIFQLETNDQNNAKKQKKNQQPIRSKHTKFNIIQTLESKLDFFYLKTIFYQNQGNSFAK
ncbi:hypothetical protein ABPG72_011084 [Tetrahymena utriculariae]